MGSETQSALIAALFDGIAETPLWATFLGLLRQATGADHVTLILHPPARPMDEAIQLLSSDDPTPSLHRFFQAESTPAQRAPSQIEGRLYTRDELFDLYTPEEVHFYRDKLAQHKITALRQMRVREKTGVDAWLTRARRGNDFGPDDEALLYAIAPILQGVLQLYVAMERERFAASLTADAVRQLQFGWISLDNCGRVIDCDPQGALVLSTSKILSRGQNGRLIAAPRALERDIYAALDHIVQNPASRPRALTLNREPWLDMLLVPAGRSSATSSQSVSAIAYVHGDNWGSSDRHEQLGELFGLSPREARLALAISRGMSLTEAAAEFGLTIATARTYSKSIYAKTGARGLPDLVRIVMRSILAIVPHH
jgi:DNA-binding CsgD family transcriptional regulator